MSHNLTRIWRGRSRTILCVAAALLAIPVVTALYLSIPSADRTWWDPIQAVITALAIVATTGVAADLAA